MIPRLSMPFINSIENWIKIQKKNKKKKKKRERKKSQQFRKLYISNGTFTAITVCIETMNNYTNAHTFWKTSLSRIANYYLGHVSFVRSFVRNVFNKPPLFHPNPFIGDGLQVSKEREKTKCNLYEDRWSRTLKFIGPNSPPNF